MTVYDALKEQGVRISNGWRWATYGEKVWIVYERRPYAKKTKMIIMTENENLAMRKLLKED